MNNARRTKIEKLNNRLSEIMDQINELANEEQEAFDNLPEAFQEGERGEGNHYSRTLKGLHPHIRRTIANRLAAMAQK